MISQSSAIVIVPKGHPKIAQHFSAGCYGIKIISPEGTAESAHLPCQRPQPFPTHAGVPEEKGWGLSCHSAATTDERGLSLCKPLQGIANYLKAFFKKKRLFNFMPDPCPLSYLSTNLEFSDKSFKPIQDHSRVFKPIQDPPGGGTPFCPVERDTSRKFEKTNQIQIEK